MTAAHEMQGETVDVAHVDLDRAGREGGALIDADRSLPTPTEVDDAIADAAQEATLADRAHDPDPEAWARYDALMALGELRPVPEPDPEPEPGEPEQVVGGDPDFEDAARLAFGEGMTDAERTVGLGYLLELADRGDEERA